MSALTFDSNYICVSAIDRRVSGLPDPELNNNKKGTEYGTFSVSKNLSARCEAVEKVPEFRFLGKEDVRWYLD